MTLKEQGFINDTIKTKNPAEAVRRNYNIGGKGGSKTKLQAQKTASAIAVENLAKPRIKKAMKSVVEQLEKKRQMAINKLTNQKLDTAMARDLTGIIDTLTKNIQLMGGKATERTEITGFTYIKPEAQNDVLKPVKEPINTKQP